MSQRNAAHRRRTPPALMVAVCLTAGWLAVPAPTPASAATAAQISAGGYHTCALTATGGATCWGDDDSEGQLGMGYGDRWHLAPVRGLASGVAQVSAGALHTCAVTTTGGVKCWGWNWAGQLGDGTGANRPTPVNVTGLTSGVAQISAGEDHTCALTTSGGVKCWGYNANGQLGDGTEEDRSTPVNVTGLTSGVSQISAGTYHTCAVTTSGGAKCWGSNGFGRLGDGTEVVKRSTPVNVSGLTSGVAHISASVEHTCAVTTSGGAKCWGRNLEGRLGDGTTTNRPTPVDVSGLTSGVAAISTGGAHTCAVTTSGGVKCWGLNYRGQLGDGTTTNRPTPVNVSGLPSGVSQISAGRQHTCAVTTTGGAKCWGANDGDNYGTVGDGTVKVRKTPVNVAGLPVKLNKIVVKIKAPAKATKGTKITVTGKLTRLRMVEFCAGWSPRLTLRYGKKKATRKVDDYGDDYADYRFTFKVKKTDPAKKVVVQAMFAETPACEASKSPKKTIKLT